MSADSGGEREGKEAGKTGGPSVQGLMGHSEEKGF